MDPLLATDPSVRCLALSGVTRCDAQTSTNKMWLSPSCKRSICARSFCGRAPSQRAPLGSVLAALERATTHEQPLTSRLGGCLVACGTLGPGKARRLLLSWFGSCAFLLKNQGPRGISALLFFIYKKRPFWFHFSFVCCI